MYSKLELSARSIAFSHNKYLQVKRQHEDDIKEINQNMIVRVKASKDIKRLTDERNAAMQV